MKTKKTVKKMLSCMLAVTMFMSCIVSTAYASTTAVSGTTWKETLAGADVEVPEVYNAEDGTFGESLRVVSHSAGEASRTYMFGVELGEKIESGTLVVDAVFSNVAASAWSIINIFGIANEESGWKTAEKSGFIRRFVADALQTTDGSARLWTPLPFTKYYIF